MKITQADKSAPVEDFLANPIGLGRIEEHTSQYHLVIDKVNGTHSDDLLRLTEEVLAPHPRTIVCYFIVVTDSSCGDC